MMGHTVVFVCGGLGAILLGMAVLAAARLVAVRRFSLAEDSLVMALGIVGMALLVIGGFWACLGMFGPLGLLLWAAGVVVFVDMLARRWRARQYELLWLMTVAAERPMPLGPAIDAFAVEQGGRFGWRARRLGSMLAIGVPLPEALRDARVLPAGALPVVELGCQNGGLAAALRQAAGQQDLDKPLWSALEGPLLYLVVVPSIAAFAVVFTMLKVVPSLVKVFADFSIRLPLVTRTMIEASEWAAALSPVLVLALLALLALLVYVVLRSRGIVHWDPPGVRGLLRRLDTAAILRALALAVERQMPMPAALASLAESYPKAHIRKRLRLAAAEATAGRPWPEAMFDRGLIRRPELGVLRAAERAGNLAWALTEMADSSTRRLAYRVQALEQVAIAPVVIALGLVVAFFVISMFVPLLTLIQAFVP